MRTRLGELSCSELRLSSLAGLAQCGRERLRAALSVSTDSPEGMASHVWHASRATAAMMQKRAIRRGCIIGWMAGQRHEMNERLGRGRLGWCWPVRWVWLECVRRMSLSAVMEL